LNDEKTFLHPAQRPTPLGRRWFPVRSIFSYNDLGKEISPFLLLDYAGPENFPPSEQRRGVGAHPHRGFETVTIVYSGEVEHRDSSGGGGIVRPGDVQWMTAASGLVHEEFHGSEYAKRGGPLEMIQLWVNLSAKDKKAPPGYQNITNAQIPRVDLPSGAGIVRVIAGNYQATQGPAHTFSPMNVWDVRLTAGNCVEFRVPTGWTAALFVLNGTVRLGSGEIVGAAELAVLERGRYVCDRGAGRGHALVPQWAADRGTDHRPGALCDEHAGRDRPSYGRLPQRTHGPPRGTRLNALAPDDP
jgi:hypothetical protein